MLVMIDLAWDIKVNPGHLLGDSGEMLMPSYLRELQYISSVLHGGGSNVLFEIYAADFGFI